MKKIPNDIRKKLDTNAARIDPGFKKNLKKELFEGTMATDKKNSILNLIRTHKYAPFGATLLAVLIVGGASASVTNNRAQLARQQELALPADLSGVLSTADLQSQILAELPNSAITGIELEEEEGRLLYKVKFSDGTIRLYDAKSGTFVSGVEVQSSDSVPADFSAAVTIQAARTIAQNQRPGKTITKIEYETEEGIVVYSVRFSDGGRVDVSAESGAIVRVESGDEEKNREDSSSSSTDDNSNDNSNDDSDDSNSGSGSNDDSDDDRSGSSNDDSDDDNSGSSNDDDDSDDDRSRDRSSDDD